MKLTARVIDPNCAFFKVPTVQEYEKCLKEHKGFYDPKKINSKGHRNTIGTHARKR